MPAEGHSEVFDDAELIVERDGDCMYFTIMYGDGYFAKAKLGMMDVIAFHNEVKKEIEQWLCDT